MAEALEKWPIDLFSRLLPRVYQIVDEINRRFVDEIRAKYPNQPQKVKNMAVLYDGQVLSLIHISSKIVFRPALKFSRSKNRQ